MTGESDLAQLLASMAPELLDDEFVFCTVGELAYADFADLSPLASFREREGLTLVLSRAAADRAGLGYPSVFRCISLSVHSSLDAVGLTAAVATCLARQGISANVIAAYYHDHIFVPSDRALEALGVLHRAAEGES